MKSTKSACLIISLIVGSIHAQTVSPADYRPSWHIDQTWQVAVSKLTEPKATPEDKQKFQPRTVVYTYQFTVESLSKIDEDECYQVRIECIKIDGHEASGGGFYRVYFRQADCSLSAIQRILKKDSRVEVTRKFPRGPVNATDWVGSLPMDFPIFDPNAVEFTPVKKTNKDGSVDVPMDQAHQKCSGAERIINDEKRAVLSVSLEKKSMNGEVERKTTQIWLPKMPWWIEAQHFHKDKIWCTAKLIKVDNSEYRHGQ
jgi:hypothetical protein